MSTDPLEISDLPPEKQQEILDFIEFLRSKKSLDSKKRFNFEWEGCLEEFKDKYTSLELQKKALDWRE